MSMASSAGLRSNDMVFSLYKHLLVSRMFLKGHSHDEICTSLYVLHMCKFAWRANSRHVNAKIHT